MPRYPFSPELLDAFPEELAELFRGLELTLLDEICSRLRVSGQLNQVTVQDIRALRSHGIDLKAVKKAISEASGTGEAKLERLLNDAAARNQAYYGELMDLARVTAPERLVGESDLAAIRRQTWAAYRNITGSMGYLAVQGGRLVLLPPARVYHWALDSALLQVQSGAVSYNQAIAGAVRQLAESGLKTVSYESGHRDSVDVAVRRAVMTGVNQLNQKYREQSMEYLGTDLVEVTAHLGARNTDGPNGWENHAKWQGKVYQWASKARASRGRYPEFEGTCGYGSVTGIGGANCRHSFWPFIEGVSERTYTDAELEAMKPENRPKIRFEGREYDDYQATQKQRQLERTIRKQKRLKAAYESAGLSGEAAAAGSKLRILNQKYQAFSRAAGLPEQRERMRAYLFQSGLKSTEKLDIMRSGNTLSDGYTSIDRTWSIDLNDKAKVSETVEDFAGSFANAEREHSAVITRSGDVFLLTGTAVTVNPAVIGPEKLPGSIGVHNHPIPDGEAMGDSFSRADLMFSARYRTGMEYLVSGSRRNAFEFLREYTEEEIYRAWEEAFQFVKEQAFSGKLIIYWEQEEILKVLAERLEGFVFYENF